MDLGWCIAKTFVEIGHENMAKLVTNGVEEHEDEPSSLPSLVFACLAHKTAKCLESLHIIRSCQQVQVRCAHYSVNDNGVFKEVESRSVLSPRLSDVVRDLVRVEIVVYDDFGEDAWLAQQIDEPSSVFKGALVRLLKAVVEHVNHPESPDAALSASPFSPPIDYIVNTSLLQRSWIYLNGYKARCLLGVLASCKDLISICNHFCLAISRK